MYSAFADLPRFFPLALERLDPLVERFARRAVIGIELHGVVQDSDGGFVRRRGRGTRQRRRDRLLAFFQPGGLFALAGERPTPLREERASARVLGVERRCLLEDRDSGVVCLGPAGFGDGGGHLLLLLGNPPRLFALRIKISLPRVDQAADVGARRIERLRFFQDPECGLVRAGTRHLGEHGGDLLVALAGAPRCFLLDLECRVAQLEHRANVGARGVERLGLVENRDGVRVRRYGLGARERGGNRLVPQPGIFLLLGDARCPRPQVHDRSGDAVHRRVRPM